MDDYLQLLKRQVDEELAYLISNYHNTSKPKTTCIFCLTIGERNSCDRYAILSKFRDDIDRWIAKTDSNPAYLPDNSVTRKLLLL